MALFIRDAEVDALAEELRKLTKARTKTEAVRRALQAQLADAMGPSDPACGMKAYTDELWGDALVNHEDRAG